MSALVATVSQLRARAEEALLGRTASTPPSKTAAVALGGAALSWRFLTGRLHGNIDNGDLELRGDSGAVAVSIDASGSDAGPWRAPSGAEVTIRVDDKFTLLAEAVDSVNVSGSLPSMALAVRVPISSIMGVETVDSDDDDASPIRRSTKHESGLKDIFVLVTHIASTTQETNRWAIAVRPQYRHIYGVVFRVPRDAQATGIVERAHCAELLVAADCGSAWRIKKHGLYRVRACRIRSESDKSAGFDVLAPADDHAVRALQIAWQDRGVSSPDQLDVDCEGDSFCILPVIDEIKRIMPSTSGAEPSGRRKLRVYRVDRLGSFEPIVFQLCTAGALDNAGSACAKHEECQQARQGANPKIEASSTSSVADLVLCSSVQLATAVHRLPNQALQYITAMMACLWRRNAQSWRQVSTFVAQSTASEPAEPDANIHQSRLVTLVGAVCERRYYWRDIPQYGGSTQKKDAPVVGEKRRHEDMSLAAVEPPCVQKRLVMAVVRVRDLSSLDTIDVYIDVHKFGFRASLQPGDVVEFSKLQGFIARSTYRAYMNWGYLTSARLLRLVDSSLPSDAELFGSLPTSFLNDLYSTGSAASNGAFDRRIHRYVVRVVYVNYVILKRKCRTCHRALVHDRRRGWMHFTPTIGEPSLSQPSRQCGWHQLQHMDAALARRSYVHTNMRCIVDDGSAQAELFLENEVAWELLRCSPAQRSRLLDVRVSELRFFAGQTPTAAGFFSSSGVNVDEQYYENQLREVVLSAVAELRQLAVFARRFYSKTSEAQSGVRGHGGAASGSGGPTSILTFGRNVQVVTRTVPPAKLDARRVDDLHVKSELRQLLARLRV